MYRDDRIRSEMTAQRFTDEAMAEKTGLTRQTIAQYRKGEATDPKLSTLTSIATALGKDVLWLLEPKPAPVGAVEVMTA